MPTSKASWRSVKLVRQYARDQQHPVSQRQAPRSAPADRVRTCTPQHRHQLAETAGAQPGETGAIQDGCDAVITPAAAKIVPWHVHLPDLEVWSRLCHREITRTAARGTVCT
jgi:hypothetical protein